MKRTILFSLFTLTAIAPMAQAAVVTISPLAIIKGTIKSGLNKAESAVRSAASAIQKGLKKAEPVAASAVSKAKDALKPLATKKNAEKAVTVISLASLAAGAYGLLNTLVESLILRDHQRALGWGRFTYITTAVGSLLGTIACCYSGS